MGCPQTTSESTPVLPVSYSCRSGIEQWKPLHFLRCLQDRVHPIITTDRHLPNDELEQYNEALTAYFFRLAISATSTKICTFHTAGVRRSAAASQSEYWPRWLVSAADP
ncbi:hypothetical protein HII31_03620 [Pseudocercospora fuligena]|uniref:Uncharacterized protein n=1 Tax=Pseudocercospora fuligena TaxID=685502 RepID=A0A8H6RRL4_9PEZI|nr:hypothetical protein HII31_03620 [Pseudocercospora fuligena]